ncbi:MAG TPA: family 1 encapsulin nanocompartment shell protein [Ilumatobacteraceae bacterium]|nr:family 1 encapsulin nanocompartment shell protein [Ilumatobacteraceae bacterium]
MNHLLRDLAPITERGWEAIDQEATRSLKHYLAARRLIDFDGPFGWEHSAVDLGRVTPIAKGPIEGVSAVRRSVLPLVELRAPFFLPRSELAAADRGADDVDLDSVIAAGRAAALAEDGMVFHGYAAADIAGIIPSSPHPAVTIGDDYGRYPEHVARAVAILRAADIDGPYAVALGSRCFTGVTETTERGGYPVFHHLREILGGPVVWAPAVDGAVVLSQRGDDFEITIGEDFSIGYMGADADSVQLYIEETIAFRVNTPEAAVHLAYPSESGSGSKRGK